MGGHYTWLGWIQSVNYAGPCTEYLYYSTTVDSLNVTNFEYILILTTVSYYVGPFINMTEQ